MNDKQRRRKIFEAIASMSDDQLAGDMCTKLLELRDKTPEQVRRGLKEILDSCAYYGLASSFVMKVLDFEWRQLGGNVDDDEGSPKGDLDDEIPTNLRMV